MVLRRLVVGRGQELPVSVLARIHSEAVKLALVLGLLRHLLKSRHAKEMCRLADVRPRPVDYPFGGYQTGLVFGLLRHLLDSKHAKEMCRLDGMVSSRVEDPFGRCQTGFGFGFTETSVGVQAAKECVDWLEWYPAVSKTRSEGAKLALASG